MRYLRSTAAENRTLAGGWVAEVGRALSVRSTTLGRGGYSLQSVLCRFDGVNLKEEWKRS